MPKKQTLEEFIKKSNIAHNFKYNYDKSIYINKQTKVIVICPEHGDFEVTPGAHYILKSGCPECAKISRSKTKSKGLETKSPSTIYHLTDVSMWAIGNQEIVTSNMPA